VPAAETCSVMVDGGTRRTRHRVREHADRGEVELRRRHRAAMERRQRAGRSEKPIVRKSIGAGASRAFAKMPDLLPATRGMSIVDGSGRIAGPARGKRLDHEGDIVGRVTGDRGCDGCNAQGASRSRRIRTSSCPERLAMLRGGKAEPREVARSEAYLG